MLGRTRVVDAVGAAHFHLGEQKRQQAAALKVPRYAGPQTVDGVDAYINSTLADWARKRQQIASDAQSAYQQVIAIRPVPPPRWVVAALARTGELWQSFAEDFVAAKLPDRLARDADTLAAFERALKRSAEPAHKAAQRSFISEDNAP